MRILHELTVMALAVLPRLKILLLATPLVIKEVVSSDIAIVNAIAELALNVLYNESIVLTAKQERLFRQHKSLLIKLASSKTTPAARKKLLLLKQGQKIIPHLLHTALLYLCENGKGNGSGIAGRMEAAKGAAAGAESSADPGDSR